jgi:hypothetical protein
MFPKVVLLDNIISVTKLPLEHSIQSVVCTYHCSDFVVLGNYNDLMPFAHAEKTATNC